MPGAAHDSTTPPLPSVFISYASADRAAARLLRDTLAEAGLEVWLDEEELAGGEAWDAKIRNQIRTCTYFMPVISATTEVRREGYFRREWRLAVERTLDLADDVMFLVPVVIDDTRDAGARVPEKFFTVQWLRAPGGVATPALRELARRLVRGDATAADAAAPAPAAVPAGKAGKPGKHAEPPPFPKFPAYPEHGKNGRFLYDLVIWFGHLIHSLWLHLPRWLRVIVAFIIIFNLVSWLFRESRPEPAPRRSKSEIADQVKRSLGDTARAPEGQDKAAAAIESLVGAAAEAIQSGRPVALIPFDGEDDAGETLADGVFDGVCELLKQEDKPLWGVSPLPLKPDAIDAEVIGRGLRMKSRFVLTGHAGKPIPGQASVFTARLFETGKGELVWKETFETGANDADRIARRIADEVTKRLETVPPPAPPATPGS
jgi:TolB-like protein